MQFIINNELHILLSTELPDDLFPLSHAPRLSFIQDTGLLYRAVGFKALKGSIAFDDVERLVRLSNSLSPEDLSDPDLRGDEAAKAASQVSVGNGSIQLLAPICQSHLHIQW